MASRRWEPQRFSGDERLLIVINPSGKAAQFAYEGKLGQALYTVGDAAVQEGTGVCAAPVSAGIYRIG